MALASLRNHLLQSAEHRHLVQSRRRPAPGNGAGAWRIRRRHRQHRRQEADAISRHAGAGDAGDVFSRRQMDRVSIRRIGQRRSVRPSISRARSEVAGVGGRRRDPRLDEGRPRTSLSGGGAAEGADHGCRGLDHRRRAPLQRAQAAHRAGRDARWRRRPYFDATGDGSRLAVLQDVEGAARPGASHVIVVFNFFAEVRRAFSTQP